MSQDSYVVSKRTDIDERLGCGDIIYQILITLCAVSFVRNCHLKTRKKCIDNFCRGNRRTQKVQGRKHFCFSFYTNRFIDIVSISRIRQHAVIYFLFYRSSSAVLERWIQNVLMFSQSQWCLYSRTAACVGLNRQSKQRSITI